MSAATAKPAAAPQIKLSVVSKTGTVLVGPGKDTAKYTARRLAQIVSLGDGALTKRSAGQSLLAAMTATCRT